MPGAPCLPAAAAIDHFKSKEAGDVSGGSTGKKSKQRKMLCSAGLLSKNELECVSNLASVEYEALQSFATINKVLKTHRI